MECTSRHHGPADYSVFACRLPVWGLAESSIFAVEQLNRLPAIRVVLCLLFISQLISEQHGNKLNAQ